MPELPEAETIARGLRPRVLGRRIEGVAVKHVDVLRTEPGELRRGVEGRRVEGVGRRGKNIVLLLDSGGRLVVNLGMTGRLLTSDGPDPPEATHPAVVFGLAGGRSLVFDDTRRFGTIELLSPDDWKRWDARLGPEPLGPEYTARDLGEALSRSRAPVKSWLLDQRRLAGVGNIYASEALWRARVHPVRPARSLGGPEVRRLHRGIRSVLRGAIRAGGTTIRDYRTVEGSEGEFVRRLAVYGREGRACPRCSHVIQRIVLGNRSTFYCPCCQPE